MITIYGESRKTLFIGNEPKPGDLVELVCVRNDESCIDVKLRVRASEDTEADRSRRIAAPSTEGA